MNVKSSATELVDSCGGNKNKQGCWLDNLLKGDHTFVMEVLEELQDRPDVPLRPVAVKLIETLQLQRSPETVARTLRRVLNGQKEKARPKAIRGGCQR